MGKLIDISLKYKKIITIIFIFMIGYGIMGYINIPKKEFPSTAIPLIVLDIKAPGYTANEINDEVLSSVEDKLKEIENIDHSFSYAFSNGGIIFLQFELDVLDVTEYVTEIKNNIDALQLKDGIDVIVSSDFNESHIVYAIEGEDRDKNANILGENIAKVKNVKFTNVTGTSESSFKIEVDVEKLASLNLSYDDFIKFISAKATDIPLGYINSGDKYNPIVTTNRFKEALEIENIILGINPQTGMPIYLKDIAIVSTEKSSESYIEFDNQEAVFLEVYFEDNLDYTVLGKEVTKVVEKFDVKGDAKVNELIYQPETVAKEINKIFTNLLQSIILVIIVVIIGLGIRNSLLITVTFPFVVFGTIGILYSFGQDLQKVSIAGLIISIGMIVDNSIVMNDSIQHYLDSGYGKVEAIKTSVKENLIPILTSTATTIAAFTPLLFLSGIAGTIAYSLPVTVIIALILSFIMSLIISPLLAYYFLKPRKQTKNKTEKESMKNLLRKLISRPIINIFVILSLITALSLTFFTLDIKIFPTAEKDVIYIQYTNTESTDFDKTVDLNGKIVNYIESLSYIKNRIEKHSSIVKGRMPQFYATLPMLPQNQNQGFIYIDLKNGDDITNLTEKLNSDLNDEFGNITTISADQIELNTPTAPLKITITGNDTKEIIDFASNKYEEIKKEVDGIGTSSLIVPNETELYKIVMNEDFINMNSITEVEVNLLISEYLNSMNLDLVSADDFSESLKVKSNIENIDNLINAPFIIKGNKYTGSDLFSVEKGETYESFYRDKYENSIQLDIYPDKNASVYKIQEDVEKILNKDLPDTIIVGYAGEAELANDVFGDVANSAVVALIAIIIILLLQFNSFKNSALVLITVPLSLAGSLFALYIFNQPISFTVALGLTSLMGIVVNNGILLVSYMQEYRKTRDSMLDVATDAVYRRMRPILLSNVTTVIGLIPLVLYGGEFFRPMAITLMGGLIIGTILTLVLVPSVYYLINKKVDLKK